MSSGSSEVKSGCCEIKEWLITEGRKRNSRGAYDNLLSLFSESFNVVREVHTFNHKAGLASKGYSDVLETSFQIEEALEGLRLDELASSLRMDVTSSPKDIARDLTDYLMRGSIQDVDRLDKACDAVVFAIGAMTKLGLDPEQINRALGVVTTANNAKLDCPKDDYGKLTKPADFDEKYAPEPKLQAILDER